MELQQRSLIKISLIGFLICFILIYFIDYHYELKSQNIDSISIKDIDKYVKINGTLERVAVKNNNVFFEIKNNNSSIKAVLFDSNISLNHKENYSVEGRLTSYKGDLEIIVYKIEQEN